MLTNHSPPFGLPKQPGKAQRGLDELRVDEEKTKNEGCYRVLLLVRFTASNLQFKLRILTPS